jgi:hypothetical protein
VAHTDKDLPRWVVAQHDPNAEVWHAPGCPHRPDQRLARTSVVVGVEVEERVDWRISPTTGEPYAKTVANPVEVRQWLWFARTCDLIVRGGRCHHYLPSYRGRRRMPFEPARAQSRDALRNARADYNTHGDTDVEPVAARGRLDCWD